MCAFNDNKPVTEAQKQEQDSNSIETLFYFPTCVYTLNKPEFLEATRALTTDFINQIKEETKELDEIYPVYMTKDLRSDARIEPFANYVANTAWNILDNQGYDMSNLRTYFTEMWCQEHYKHSAMEQHIHGYGAQIVGFYFIDCPENSSRVVFHDPKAAKVQISLPEQNVNNVTQASSMVNLEPKPGMLLFTNAWLPHSFTRNASDKPFRFIHFNLTAQQPERLPTSFAPAEVI